MDYVELNIPVANTEQSGIVIAYLSDFPFESFSEDNDTLKAYIPKNALYDCKDKVDALLTDMGITGTAYIEIETQNWNALWESNFTPVEVDSVCTIRAPFSPAPLSGLDIVIMPKMSFGTGHHATTWLMRAEIMKCDMNGMNGLDMGVGPGVLAVVVVMRGSIHVHAVYIDDWSHYVLRSTTLSNIVSYCISLIIGCAFSL